MKRVILDTNIYGLIVEDPNRDIVRYGIEKKKAVIYENDFPYAEKINLDYEIEIFPENRFLWNIELHTGKFHQIRAQLSNINCPIVGDILYNSDVPYKPDSIALHAYKLIFHHPITSEEISIVKRSDF